MERTDITEERIRNYLKSGTVKDLKATILYRPIGSLNALIEINGKKFTIDSVGRLKVAGVSIDYSRRISLRGKTEGQINEYLKQFPKLGKEDFHPREVKGGDIND